MDESNVRAEQLLYQVGELGALLTHAEFADVPVDRLTVSRLLHEAKAVYDASVQLLRASTETQHAKQEEETKYDVSTELLLSPCVDRRQCKYMWESARDDPAVRDLVAQLQGLKKEIRRGGDLTQRVVQIMKKVEAARPAGASKSPYPMCMITGFPCAVTLIERRTAVTFPKHTLQQAAVSEALRMFEYAKAVTRKYVVELESLQGGGLSAGFTEDVRALTAAAVYLEAHPMETTEVVQSFYSLLPVPPSVQQLALHQLELARAAPDTLRAFLAGGGVLQPLTKAAPLRARDAAQNYYKPLWQSHLLHFMGPVPKYSYDAVGDRAHIVVQ